MQLTVFLAIPWRRRAIFRRSRTSRHNRGYGKVRRPRLGRGHYHPGVALIGHRAQKHINHKKITKKSQNSRTEPQVGNQQAIVTATVLRAWSALEHWSRSVVGAPRSLSGRGLSPERGGAYGEADWERVWSAIGFAWLKLSIRELCGCSGDMLCRQATWYRPSPSSATHWPRAISTTSHCLTLYTHFIQITLGPFNDAYYCAAQEWVIDWEAVIKDCFFVVLFLCSVISDLTEGALEKGKRSSFFMHVGAYLPCI